MLIPLFDSTRPRSRIVAGFRTIIAYQSVPKECVVKVVSESGKRDLFASQFDTSRRTKSNTQRYLGSYSIPTVSRSWPDEECE